MKNEPKKNFEKETSLSMYCIPHKKETTLKSPKVLIEIWLQKVFLIKM